MPSHEIGMKCKTASDKYDKFHVDYEYKAIGQYSPAEVDEISSEEKVCSRGWDDLSSDDSFEKNGWGTNSFSKQWPRVEPSTPTDVWGAFKENGWKSRNKTTYSARLASFEDNQVPYQYADFDLQVAPAMYFPVLAEKEGATLNALANQFKLVKIFKKAGKDDNCHIDALFDTLVGMFLRYFFNKALNLQ